MNSNSTSARLGRLLANPYSSSLLVLIAIACGILLGSTAILISGALLAIGRPFLYIMLISRDAESEGQNKRESMQRVPFRSIATAH